MFDTRIGNQVTRIPQVDGLSALEIDPQAAARLSADRRAVRGLPRAWCEHREQLSGACTTEIAAFDEFTGLLIDIRLVGEYDHIVFTAPTGHPPSVAPAGGQFLAQGRGCVPAWGRWPGWKNSEANTQRPSRPCRIQSEPGSSWWPCAGLDPAAKWRVPTTLAAIGPANRQLVINGIFPPSELAEDPWPAPCGSEQGRWRRCHRC